MKSTISACFGLGLLTLLTTGPADAYEALQGPTRIAQPQGFYRVTVAP